jgi:hypothetical protein
MAEGAKTPKPKNCESREPPAGRDIERLACSLMSTYGRDREVAQCGQAFSPVFCRASF